MFAISFLFLISVASAVWECTTCVADDAYGVGYQLWHQRYCPDASDLVVAYGKNVTLRNQGWTIAGGGGVATKAAFNLLGGSVEFFIDVSKVNAEVNTNIYGISPAINQLGFQQSNYCDGSMGQPAKCMEIDWVENNGKCVAATTIHTKVGTGNDGCNSWGCRKVWKTGASYTLKITYDSYGGFKVYKNGIFAFSSDDLLPKPTLAELQVIVDNYIKSGTVVYSSQWQGWVPARESCPTGGSLSTSNYGVSRLIITGSVVRGPEPTKCLRTGASD